MYIYIRTYSTSIPPSRRAKVNTPSPPVEISNGTPPPLYMALAKVSTALAEPTLETPPYPGVEWGGGGDATGGVHYRYIATGSRVHHELGFTLCVSVWRRNSGSDSVYKI